MIESHLVEGSSERDGTGPVVDAAASRLPPVSCIILNHSTRFHRARNADDAEMEHRRGNWATANSTEVGNVLNSRSRL